MEKIQSVLYLLNKAQSNFVKAIENNEPFFVRKEIQAEMQKLAEELFCLYRQNDGQTGFA